MQFNNDISVEFDTLNEFGESIANKAHKIKCSVLLLNKGKKKTAGDSKTLNFRLKILVPYKGIYPYSQLLSVDDLSFVYKGLRYGLESIEPINNFSGKIKYYEIDLKEKK